MIQPGKNFQEVFNGRSRCSKSTKLKWLGKRFPRTVTSENSDLELSYQMIERFIDLWDWSGLINHWWEERRLYTFDFLERYADKIPSSKLLDSHLWTALVEQRKKDLKLEVIA